MILHALEGGRVSVEMTTKELAMLSTMLGYSCAAARDKGHFIAEKEFSKLAQKLMNAQEVTMKVNGGIVS